MRTVWVLGFMLLLFCGALPANAQQESVDVVYAAVEGSTIRIFSSAVNLRRVLRLISRTMDSGEVLDFFSVLMHFS